MPKRCLTIFIFPHKVKRLLNLYLKGMIYNGGKNRRKKQGLLHFSSKADHGFLLLMSLADASGGKLTLQKIAAANGISFYFLQKVALELRKAGLISADRGKSGGYHLLKHPSAISVKEVVEALEGPLALTVCLSKDFKGCSMSESCRLKPGFNLINSIILTTLGQKTLQDLINAYEHS